MPLSLAERRIDKATANRVTAIETGTDPTVINPRLAQLRAERDTLTHQLVSKDAPDRLSPADIDTLLNELGGLTNVLTDATSPEKATIYQELGLHPVYEPDQQTQLATADLGRVLSRVGGPTRTLRTRSIPRSAAIPLAA